MQVTLAPDKSKRQSWIFRYATAGKEHWLSLGSPVDISLAEARAKAAEQRKLRLDGTTPSTQNAPTRLPRPKQRLPI